MFPCFCRGGGEHCKVAKDACTSCIVSATFWTFFDSSEQRNHILCQFFDVMSFSNLRPRFHMPVSHRCPTSCSSAEHRASPGAFSTSSGTCHASGRDGTRSDPGGPGDRGTGTWGPEFVRVTFPLIYLLLVLFRRTQQKPEMTCGKGIVSLRELHLGVALQRPKKKLDDLDFRRCSQSDCGAGLDTS